jgi:hypothetical protein
MRKAANAAEAERKSTGLATTVTFIQLIRDAALTGTIPSNPQLVATIDSWRGSTAMQTEGLSPTGQRLVTSLKELARLLSQFLEQRNGDELLQRFLHHVYWPGSISQLRDGAHVAKNADEPGNWNRAVEVKFRCGNPPTTVANFTSAASTPESPESTRKWERPERPTIRLTWPLRAKRWPKKPARSCESPSN